MGFLYDFIRIARRSVKHSNLMVQIEDIIYWVVVALAMFLLMLSQNYGEIRLFSIAGMVIGMVIYFLTLSHIFLKVSVAIINLIKKIICVIFNILATPFRLMAKLASIPLKYIKKCGKKVHKSNKKVLKKITNCAKMKYNSFKKQARAIFNKKWGE